MMTTDPIVESGLTFGPFPEGCCFYIEKSKAYKQIEKGVKMVEFLLLRQNTGKAPAIWVVEAKSSAPNAKSEDSFDKYMKEIRASLTSDRSDEYVREVCERLMGNDFERCVREIREKLTGNPFDTYIGDICDKFINALTLAVNICLKRHPNGDRELSDDFKQLDLASVNFVLVLVIGKDFKKEGLPPLQDALLKVLRPTVKTWALSPPAVLVLNEDMAREKGLIALANTT
ncbi:MAG: hypothetical protein SGJ02_00345 [bacterium]|nr:hypothetical protein [bacterium]